MPEFKVGDRVRRKLGKGYCDGFGAGEIGVIYNICSYGDSIDIETSTGDISSGNVSLNLEFVENTNEVDKKMELENIKKENLKEAQKQFEEDKKNAEIETAKKALRAATDSIDRIDREIKKLEEEKKPHLEILKQFK